MESGSDVRPERTVTAHEDGDVITAHMHTDSGERRLALQPFLPIGGYICPPVVPAAESSSVVDAHRPVQLSQPARIGSSDGDGNYLSVVMEVGIVWVP